MIQKVHVRCSALFAALCLLTLPCAAVEVEGIQALLLGTAQIGEPLVVNGTTLESAPVYDNTTADDLAGVYFNGGAAGGITRMVADDTTPSMGGILDEFTFSVVNNNDVPVSARPRIRFWAADGAGGGPGTLISGFTFQPIQFPAESLNAFTTGLGLSANNIVLPNATMWWGMTFDNNPGIDPTGISTAQLNNLGQILIDPPSVGSSNDQLYWQSTAAGSFFVSNPVGATATLVDAPSNFYWEYQVVPEPAAMLSLLIGVVGLGLRRRA